jgi:acetylglutamate kinase
MLKRRSNETGWTSAKTLSEALPFIQRYADQTIVIKFGGNAMGSEDLTQQFANDVVLLQQMGLRPVIVHGGGPQIGTMLKRLNIQSEFVDGLRVSDIATVEVAEMVLSGAINKSIVHALNQAGGKAVGLSGKDANLIKARQIRKDLGFAGVPTQIDTGVIETLAKDGFVPVVSPISAGESGGSYNVNADTAAGRLAGALGASRLMLLTDIEGVKDKEGNLLTNLSLGEARGLIADGTAQGGMIPKLETAIAAVEEGVSAVVILDGRRAHGLLVELFTDQGAGTLLR